MQIRRRTLMAMLFALGVTPTTSFALTEDEARAVVAETVREMLKLMEPPRDHAVMKAALQDIMERRAAVPQISRFVAGRAWREMSPDQQKRFEGVYVRAMSDAYARRFAEFTGDAAVTVGRSIDAGRKGILVETPLTQGGQEPVRIEWLVSDRGGSAQIVDLIIEGISMAATQRDEISAMLVKRNNDVDLLMTDLDPAE